MIPNPDYEKWVDCSIDVLYKIQLTCEEVVKCHIRHLKIPTVIWETLCDLYELKGASMQLTLVKKIFCTTLTDYSNVAKYLATIETGAADYIAAGPHGCPVIPNHLLALTVLHGLPNQFHVIITTILSHAGGNLLSLSAVKADLLDEERHLVEAGELGKGTSSAMQAGCWTNHPLQTAEEKAKYVKWLKTATCHTCGQTGHIKAKCPKESTPTKPAEVNQVASADSSSETPAVFFVNMTPPLPSPPSMALQLHPSLCKDSWVIDSGCSDHMACQLPDFANYTPF
jgi:gag-polypeptide of LTR copia-type/Zinc knuckle